MIGSVEESRVDPDYYSSDMPTMHTIGYIRAPVRYAELLDRYWITASGHVWNTKRAQYVPPVMCDSGIGGECWADSSLVYSLWDCNGKRVRYTREQILAEYAKAKKEKRTKIKKEGKNVKSNSSKK